MNHHSRTYNVVNNAKVAFICQIIYLLISFVCRTIFIKLLGASYLGVNGLFTNILTILSFTELGIGNTLVYRMYKPIEENNHEKLKSLLYFYRNVYKNICLIIMILGLACIPFLKYMVKTPDIKESVILLYFLFLVNTVASYTYIYKKSILIADQKNYIVLIYQQVFNVIMNALQIIALLLTHNYILYLLIMIACTILNNVFCSNKAEKDYPFIKEKNVTPLSKIEKKKFVTDVKGLMFQKFGSVSLDGSDNIIISVMLGINYVGYASNYILLISVINSMLNLLIKSFSASIGNLAVRSNTEKELTVFNKIYFINMWLYGFITIGFVLLLNEFIGNIWLNQSYVLPFSIVLTIVLQFYLNGIHYPIYVFRTSTGYFSQLKMAPMFAAIINIILSIALCAKFGLIGIFIGTIVSRFCITQVADIFILYKYEFKTNPIYYYLMHFKYDILFVILFFLIRFVLSYITIPNVLGFIIHIIVITAIFNITMVIIFYRTKMFRELYHTICPFFYISKGV